MTSQLANKEDCAYAYDASYAYKLTHTVRRIGIVCVHVCSVVQRWRFGRVAATPSSIIKIKYVLLSIIIA